MKLLIIVPSYKPAYIYAGTIVVIAKLAEALAAQGHDVHVYTTTANGKTELDVVPDEEVDVDGVKVTYFTRITGDHTHISTALWKELRRTVRDFDVVHIHSWWSPLIMGAAVICKLKGVKPVFSPHGMLSSYIMETNNAGKKKLLHSALGERLLKNSWLHVTADTEMEECLQVIPKWQGIVIPNLIELAKEEHPRRPPAIFTIGFISRIDPKKGLDILIKALSKVNFDYQLLIAGEGEAQYVNALKEMAAELGNEHQLEWVGWKNGERKFDYLAGVDLFALTSHNENFGVVVIEALSVGTPVLISNKVGLCTYVESNDLGWVCDMNIENITAKLNELYLERNKRDQINLSAPQLISEAFDVTVLANEYMKFYTSIVTPKKQKSRMRKLITMSR